MDEENNDFLADKSQKIWQFSKIFVFFVLSFAMVFGNFFVEGGFGSVVKSENKTVFSAFNYEKDNIIPQSGLIRFANESESGIKNSLNVKSALSDSAGNKYIFGVDSGKFWGNFMYSNAKINFVVGKIVLIPNHAVFDLTVNGNKLELSVYDGDVYTGLLSENVSVNEYVDGYSPIFMNRLLVPKDTHISINLNKINDDLSKLLYSKLVKEFKYSAIPDEQRESDFVSSNIYNDKKYSENLKQEFISDNLFKGAFLGDTVDKGGFLLSVKEFLTFMPDKKNEMMINRLFYFLDGAIFYALKGNDDLSKAMLDNFSEYSLSVPDDVVNSSEYISRFDGSVQNLFLFGLEEKPYKIFRFLLEKKLSSKRNLDDLKNTVNLFWLGVYKGLGSGRIYAADALDSYYKYFDNPMFLQSDPLFYKNYITYQNQLFDNLFLRYSLFYKDGYFAMKDALEQKLLKLYPEGSLKDELRQALINNKIGFLKRLMKFFFDGEVDVAEAKNIVSALVEEANSLMPASASEVAVTTLFEQELKDIGDFWGYLNSPQYYSGNLYGTNHKDRYKVYIDEKQKIWSFINVKEDILGKNSMAKEQTADEVSKEIIDVLSKVEDLKDVKIGEIKDVNQRYVDISAVIGGYPFKASYDRDKNIVKDIYAYDSLISDRPVKLDQLLNLLKQKFAEIAPNVLQSDQPLSEETYAERYARIYVSKIVTDAGFDADMDKVQIVDKLNAVYRLDKIQLKGYDDVFVTFDLIMNGETATNVFLSTKGNPIVMNGKYTLEELKALVMAESTFSTGVKR